MKINQFHELNFQKLEICMKVKESEVSVMSDFLQPHGL